MKIDNKGMIRTITQDDPYRTLQVSTTYPENCTDDMRKEGAKLVVQALTRGLDKELIQYAVEHAEVVDQIPIDRCKFVVAQGFALYHKMMKDNTWNWGLPSLTDENDVCYRGTIGTTPVHENNNILVDQNSQSPIIGVKEFHAYIGDVVETPLEGCGGTVNYSVTFKINSFDGWVETANSETPRLDRKDPANA